MGCDTVGPDSAPCLPPSPARRGDRHVIQRLCAWRCLLEQQEWNEYYESNEEPWTLPDEVLVAEVEDLPPGRALDLGAGEGGDSIWLAERGWEVTAVDFAPAALSTIERIAASQGLDVTPVLANVLEYQPDEPYDLVILCYMHLPPNERAIMLANAAAALASEGTLLYIGIARSEDPTDEEHQERFSTPDEIVAELPGLAIERAEVIRRIIPYPDEPYEGDGLIVRARRAMCRGGT